MKACTGCGVTKPLDQFPLAQKGKFGRGAKCSQCTALWRAGHKEWIRNYNQQYYIDNQNSIKDKVAQYAKDTNYASQKKWDPVKRKARLKVMKALASGKMKKLPCFVCGDSAEAHHPDYGSPLDVVWLCPDHHREVHCGK